MLIHFHQFGKEVIETPLLGQGADFIIGSPEVTNENPLEDPAQNLPDYGRGPASGDHVIAKFGVRKAPQPMGDADESPASLIPTENTALENSLADFIV